MTTAQIVKRQLFSPQSWIRGPFSDLLTEAMEKKFGGRVFPVNAGRSAIYLTLKAFGIGEGDEVIIQAYTCNSVPNPILWTSAKPVYVDIDEETLNIDSSKIEASITSKTKAILVQHTFGRPVDLEKIAALAEQKNLVLIEDCAHALGGKYNDRLLGTFGDAAIFSFDREKGIRSLAGGVLLINRKEKVAEAEKLWQALPELRTFQIFKILNNYLVWRVFLRRIVSKPWGKSLLNKLNNTDFFNVLTTKKENVGEKPSWYPSKMPNLYAEAAFEQLGKIELYNLEREEIAEKYNQKITNQEFKVLSPFEGTNLKITLLHPEAKAVRSSARERGMWFGNWYNKPVYPEGVELTKMNYTPGSCPIAERAASYSLNLPNHIGITEAEIDQVADFINSYANQTR